MDYLKEGSGLIFLKWTGPTWSCWTFNGDSGDIRKSSFVLRS